MKNIRDVLSALQWDKSNYCMRHQSDFLYLPPTYEVSQCPFCGTEALHQQIEDAEQKRCLDIERLERYRTLSRHSIIQDDTIRQAHFDNFIAETEEEQLNKMLSVRVAERFIQGEVFNVWIQSPETGCGKSHLAMSILQQVNEASPQNRRTLFLDFGRTMELMRDSVGNRESMYTQNYFVTLASKVDVLVLDDLGAETGDIYSDKRASEYTSNVLRSILNSRQHKPTIITTNLIGQRLLTGYREGGRFIPPMYDKKMMSRAMRKVEHILFKDTPDKRLLGF